MREKRANHCVFFSYPLDWETVYNSRVPMKILNNLDGTTYKVRIQSTQYEV